jgi:hypothetical protein
MAKFIPFPCRSKGVKVWAESVVASAFTYTAPQRRDSKLQGVLQLPLRQRHLRCNKMDQPWGNSRFGSSYCSSSRQRDAGGEETHVSLRKNQVLKPAYIDYISPAQADILTRPMLCLHR